MSDKDEIKELFQKELGNYEAKVDPSLWNGIQSGLSGASAAGGTTTAISITTKAVIGVVIATVATVSSLVIFSGEETKKQNKAKVETTEKVQKLKENKSEELVVNEFTDIKDNSLEQKNSEINETPGISEEINTNITAPVVQTTEKETELNEVGLEKEKTKDLNEEFIPVLKMKEEETQKKAEIQKPLIADISIQKQDNQYVKFNIDGDDIENVEWYFGDGRSSNDISPEHFYEEPGTFEVIAVIHGRNNDVLEKSLNVIVEVEGKFTKLPNTFTPNNDGSNDEFFIEHEGIEELQVNIFNKRQELIFSTNDPNFRWRGYNSKGERVPEGEYVYIIISKDKAGNVINKYKTLTITR